MVLRLDPENAEAKEITTMMETGGGPSVAPTRAAKPAAASAKSGDASDLMAEATPHRRGPVRGRRSHVDPTS